MQKLIVNSILTVAHCDKRKGRKVNPLFLLLQTDFVGDLGKMGIKYRMLDMDGLEKLKDSLPEEPCPFFMNHTHQGTTLPCKILFSPRYYTSQKGSVDWRICSSLSWPRYYTSPLCSSLS